MGGSGSVAQMCVEYHRRPTAESFVECLRRPIPENTNAMSFALGNLPWSDTIWFRLTPWKRDAPNNREASTRFFIGVMVTTDDCQKVIKNERPENMELLDLMRSNPEAAEAFLKSEALRRVAKTRGLSAVVTRHGTCTLLNDGDTVLPPPEQRE